MARPVATRTTASPEANDAAGTEQTNRAQEKHTDQTDARPLESRPAAVQSKKGFYFLFSNIS